MSKILIAVAVYNEIENLPELVSRLFDTVPDADILTIDDGSPDGTGEWAADMSKKDPRFFLLERGTKKGLGTAVLDAFDFAASRNYDYLINLDADFSHPPEKIPELLETAETGQFDVVIGSRYIQGGKITGWSFTRKIMSRGINIWARLFLGLTTKDNSGAFRCYRVTSLKKLDRNKILSRGYSFFEEVLFRLKQNGASFKEVPITFTDRVRGTSKINRKEAVKALLLLFKIGIRRFFT